MKTKPISLRGFFKSALIGAVGFLAGGAVTFAALKKPAPPPPKNESAVETPGPSFSDPFADFEKRQREIWHGFDHFFDVPAFAMSEGDGSGSLTQHEDKDFVYYDVKVGDLKSTSFQTQVQDGYVTISGTSQRKSRDDSSESLMESSFHRTFPVPPGVDATKMETSAENGSIVLKFPKMKT